MKDKKEKWEIIAHEYVVSLFPVFMTADGMNAMIDKKIASQAVEVAFKIENNSVTYYFLPESWKIAHQRVVNKIKSNPEFLSNIFYTIKTEGCKQVEFSQSLIKTDLKKLTNKQLNNYYQKYIKLNTNLYKYGLVISLLDFHNTTFLSDEVNNFLKSKKAESYFSILTTPLKSTYNKIQELDLLKILMLIKKDKKLCQQFKKLDSEKLAEILKNKYKNIWCKIKSHTKKYAWIHYVYEGPAATPEYFIDILKDFVKRNLKPGQELVRYQKEKQVLKLKQKKIIDKLKPDRYFLKIIDLAHQAVFYKAYRRELQTWSYYNMEFLFKEIAVRLGLISKQVRMMLPEEINYALIKNKLNVNLINQRLKLVIYGWKGGKRFCLVDRKARDFLKNVKKEKIIKNVKKITGTCACPGKAKGIVKIINMVEDMKKFNLGDILVSASTNPNLMPAIKKAAAILTDEGGLTCHAAIVSRELNIPCVVGLFVVTKVLKDGDKVEVDARGGVVKKIK